MRAKDSYQNSGKPFRSARLNTPMTAVFVNNRLDLVVSRGTYRLMAILDPVVNLTSSGVFFCVGKNSAIEQFPAGVTMTTALGELLQTSGLQTADAVHYYGHSASYVEVDVLDGQEIAMWSLSGLERVKYVKVGELPPRDPEVNDNHSANWE